MEQKRNEMRRQFLALTPLERIRRMNALFNEIILIKATTKGVKECEIYRRYIKSHR
jgi:hypothetical protein